tara:strand:+ start:3065 stop:6259 length:3195 start_codon:yes stop_codon:yes gene_type:complete
MPDREYDYRGKSYTIFSHNPLTKTQSDAFIRQRLGSPNSPSVLKKLALDPLMSSLEFLGRPAELVSGTVGGALADEKDWGRGWRAFTEGEFADSKVHETFGKVLKEQNVLPKNPYVRAGVGFAADVLTDPLNLLGGAGIVRGAAKKALMKQGVSEKAARQGLLIDNPIRQGFQSTVTPALAKGMQSVKGGRYSPFKKLFPTVQLENTLGTQGFNAEQASYLTNRLRQVNNQEDVQQLTSWVTTNNLTPEELTLIPGAIKEPGGQHWTDLQEMIRAEGLDGSTRLKDATRGFTEMTDNLWHRDLDAGLIKKNAKADWFDSDLLDELHTLPDNQRDIFTAAIRNGAFANHYGVITLKNNVGIHKHYNTLVKDGVLSASAGKKLWDLTRTFILEAQPEIMSGARKLALPKVDFSTLTFEKKWRTVVGDSAEPKNVKQFLPHFSTKRRNYVPQLAAGDASVLSEVGTKGIAAELKSYPNLAAGLRSAKEQTRSWDEYVNAGGTEDAFRILKRRFESSNSARANSDLMETWANDFTKFDGEFANAEAAATAGYRKLKGETLNFLPSRVRNSYLDADSGTGEVLQTSKWVPDSIADEIEKVVQRLDDPVRVEHFMRRALKLWKAYRTSINFPVHQANNFVGNAGAMYAATDYAADTVIKTIALTTGVVRGTKKFPKFTANGITHTNDSFLQLAKDWGLGTKADPIFSRSKTSRTPVGGLSTEYRQVGSGSRELGPSASVQALAQTDGPMTLFNPENPVIQKFQDINQQLVEDPAKLALMYLDMKAGKTAEEAILNVRKVLFDYGDLRTFEKKYLRDVVPFYTWTRKTIPLQIAALAQRPAKASHARRLFDLARDLDEASGWGNVDQEDLPPYMHRANVFPIPIPGMQGQTGKKVYGRVQYPLFELDKITADPDQFLKEWSFMLNPAIRVPIEGMILNRPMGTPSYMSLNDPDVPSSTLGRLAGAAGVGGLVGAWQDPDTGDWRQSGRGRWASREVPIPFSPLARGIDPGGSTTTGLNPFIEMLMRAMALSPMGVTEETLSRGRGQATRRRNNPPGQYIDDIQNMLSRQQR